MFGQILSNKNEKVLYLQYRPEFGGAESDTKLNVAQIIGSRHHEHGNLESQAQATVSDDRAKTIDIPDLVTNSTYRINK